MHCLQQALMLLQLLYLLLLLCIHRASVCCTSLQTKHVPAGAAALQDKYNHMLIFWRPDLKIYKATVLEEVPASSPFNPPAINASLTPKGGVFHPESDSFASTAGQMIAAVHSDKDSTGFSCKAFGSYMLNGGTFGWVLGFKQGAGGVITPVVSDNGTGTINEMQVN
jgi:hypothetical protein